MRGSSVVLAQQAVVDLINGLPGFGLAAGSVPAFYEWQGDESPAECVFGDGLVEFERSITGMRPDIRSTEEEYDLSFALDVLVDGGSQAEADTRCLELYEPIERAISSTPRLGLDPTVGILGAWCGRGRLQRVYTASSKGARLIFSVHVKVRQRGQ